MSSEKEESAIELKDATRKETDEEDRRIRDRIRRKWRWKKTSFILHFCLAIVVAAGGSLIVALELVIHCESVFVLFCSTKSYHCGCEGYVWGFEIRA